MSNATPTTSQPPTAKPAPSPVVSRAILQQCLSAKLQLNRADDASAAAVEGEEGEPVFATVGRGLVVYVCFLKGAAEEAVEKLVKSVLSAKLSEGEFGSRRVAILDLPGDILVVPQASFVSVIISARPGADVISRSCAILHGLFFPLGCGRRRGGRLKGKSMQYHNNIEKSQGHSLYQTFVCRLEEEMKQRDNCRENSVRCGTYGNRQVLSLETNGPYTHLIEI